MVVLIGGLLVSLVVLSYLFYLLAGWSAGVAIALGAPASYGAAIANLVTLMLVVVMITASMLVVAERKWSAMMQNRIGPNRIRVFGWSLGGIPFLLADALKMLTKENTEPAERSRLLFNLAPILSLAPAFALFAVVPVGQEVQVLGHRVSLQVASIDAGLLFVFAVASIMVYGTTLAGWASNNKMALVGGIRASSQMISYEVSLGLSLVGTMMAFQSLRLDEMVEAQGQTVWGFVPAIGFLLQPLGFLIFFASAFAETKRAPFDLPEGESEIVGYFMEYSGMKFGVMMLSEFIEIVVLGGIVTAIFFGGWHPILFEGWLRQNLSPVWFAAVGAASFLVKTLILCWLQLAIRWALPRFRYDQIQRLCWRMLLPAALANVFITGAAILVDPSLELLAWIGLAEIVLLVALTASASRAPAEAEGHHGLPHGDVDHGHAHATHHAAASGH
jgi:NADH-quinone oxidoreductase subunit H